MVVFQRGYYYGIGIPVADAVALVSDTSDAAANNCVMILTVASLVIAGDAVILVVERSEGVTE